MIPVSFTFDDSTFSKFNGTDDLVSNILLKISVKYNVIVTHSTTILMKYYESPPVGTLLDSIRVFIAEDTMYYILYWRPLVGTSYLFYYEGSYTISRDGKSAYQLLHLMLSHLETVQHLVVPANIIIKIDNNTNRIFDFFDRYDKPRLLKSGF